MADKTQKATPETSAGWKYQETFAARFLCLDNLAQELPNQPACTGFRLGSQFRKGDRQYSLTLDTDRQEHDAETSSWRLRVNPGVQIWRNLLGPIRWGQTAALGLELAPDHRPYQSLKTQNTHTFLWGRENGFSFGVGFELSSRLASSEMFSDDFVSPLNPGKEEADFQIRASTVLTYASGNTTPRGDIEKLKGRSKGLKAQQAERDLKRQQLTTLNAAVNALEAGKGIVQTVFENPVIEDLLREKFGGEIVAFIQAELAANPDPKTASRLQKLQEVFGESTGILLDEKEDAANYRSLAEILAKGDGEWTALVHEQFRLLDQQAGAAGQRKLSERFLGELAASQNELRLVVKQLGTDSEGGTPQDLDDVVTTNDGMVIAAEERLLRAEAFSEGAVAFTNLVQLYRIAQLIDAAADQSSAAARRANFMLNPIPEINLVWSVRRSVEGVSEKLAPWLAMGYGVFGTTGVVVGTVVTDNFAMQMTGASLLTATAGTTPYLVGAGRSKSNLKSFGVSAALSAALSVAGLFLPGEKGDRLLALGGNNLIGATILVLGGEEQR